MKNVSYFCEITKYKIQAMNIKILGTGCTNCKNLEKVTIKALAELDINADVEKVEDIQRIISYGVMSTPALIINNQIAVKGRVPNLTELKEIIKKFDL